MTFKGSVTRPLPPELYEHCVILLEEKMSPSSEDAQALNILQSLATPSNHACAVPPPSFLNLLSTVAVHPSTTSRAATNEGPLASQEALAYIKLLGSRANPTCAHFSSSFVFRRAQADSTSHNGLPKHGNTRKRTRPSDGIIDLTHSSSPTDSNATSPPPSSSDSDGASRLNNALAGNSSIFSAAEGFWHVFGWAFNCSIRHPQRWLYWKGWLDSMLTIFHSELESAESPSLGLAYLSEADPSSRSGLRKLFRAIFADGSEASLSEFHEVWPGETKPPKEKSASGYSRPGQKMELDDGDFRDYWDDEMEDEIEAEIAIKSDEGANTKRTSGRTMRQPGKYHVNMDLNHGLERKDNAKSLDSGGEAEGTLEAFGGAESVHLRRKVLTWVVRFIRKHPFSRNNLADLLELAAEFIRPLSLPVYMQIVAALPTHAGGEGQDLDDVLLARLHMALLHTMQPTDKIPVFQDSLPSQAQLLEYYLPHATKSSALSDIAKTAISVEALRRLAKRHGKLTVNDELRSAVKQGIESRTKKAEGIMRRTKTTKSTDEEALTAMKDAHTFLQFGCT